jgi:hypothetical protein
MAFGQKNGFKSFAALHYRSMGSVDKYKRSKMELKVGKSVILCQQVVNLEIFIPK